MLARRIAAVLLCALAVGALPGTAAADPETQARRQLEVLADRVERTEERETVLNDRIAALDKQLAKTERELVAVRGRFGGRARAAYASGLGSDTIVVMMTTADPTAVLERLRMLDTVTRSDGTLLRRGAALRRTLTEQRRQADAARREVEAVHRALTADMAALNKLLGRLAALDNARAARRGARASRSAPRLNGRYACLVGPTRYYRDTWGAPRSGGRRHMGTDVMAPMGSPSYAVTSGVIRRLSYSSNGGRQVYLRGDDGNVYFYAHMQSYAVRTGQRVAVGELIATVGASGNASESAPHVHFEVHPGGGSPVNPYPYVRRFCG